MPPLPASRAFKAIVTGRVQGVGFREYVRHRASLLGLGGWVRNLPDGRTVEVWAAGDNAHLERLLEELREGPRLAHVSGVAVDWIGQTESADGFSIHT